MNAVSCPELAEQVQWDVGVEKEVMGAHRLVEPDRIAQ